MDETTRMKSEPGPPMTLGNAAAAPRPADRVVASIRSSATPPRWLLRVRRRNARGRERLVYSKCGSRNVDMVVSGTKRR
jgi:hypothetical protein